METSRKDLSLALNEMDKGSWVIFELPGFHNAAAGAAQSSLAALRGAPDTAYYQDGDTLWVKLVDDGSGSGGKPAPISTAPGPVSLAGGFGGGAGVEVSR